MNSNGSFYDQVEVEKYLKEDILNTKYLIYKKKQEENGFTHVYYKLYHFHKEINIIHCLENNLLKVKLNPGYFLFGHNFLTSIKDARNVFEYLSIIMGGDMLTAEVQLFEFGCLVETSFNYKKVHYSHLKIPGMKSTIFNDGKYWDDANLQHRIYNGTKNIKNKISKADREILLAGTGYSDQKNYLKVENKYKRPAIALKNRCILVNDLFKNDFIEFCNKDLIEKYESIIKTSAMNITDKKQLSSETLYLIALKRLEEAAGVNAEDFLKQTIKSFDELSADDKKNRIRQLKKNLEKVQPVNSPYDVSGLLREKLYGKQ